MAIRRLQHRLALAIIMGIVPLCSHADLYSLKIENDVIASGSDGHYSNGIELMRSFQPALRPSKVMATRVSTSIWIFNLRAERYTGIRK